MKDWFRFSPRAFVAAAAWTFGAFGSGFAHASGEPLLGVVGATVALAGSIGLRILSDRWEREAYARGFSEGRLAKILRIDRIRRVEAEDLWRREQGGAA